MADYSILSQMRGPDIDVNLIPNAMRAGAQVGEMTPTPLTAAIQGGIKGTQQGLEIAQGVQNLEKGRAELEMLPLEKQRLEADIEYQKARADDLRNQTPDPADQLNQQRLEQAQRAVAEENALFSKYQSLDPKGQGEFLLSGEYDKYFGSEPGTFQQMVDTTYQRGGLTDEQYDALSKNAQKKQVRYQWEKDLEKNASELQQLQPAWEQNPVRYELAEKLQQNPDQALTEAEFYPHGTFPVVEEKIPGTNKSRLVRGERSTNPLDPSNLQSHNRDLVDIFSKDGQFVGTVGKDQAEAAKQYRDKLFAVTGLARNRDIANIDKGKGSPTTPGSVKEPGPEQQQQQGPAAARPQSAFRTAFSTPDDAPERTQLFKSELKVADDVYEVSGVDGGKVMSDIQEIGKSVAYKGENVFVKPIEIEPLRRSAENSVREIIKAQGYANEQNTILGRDKYSEDAVKEFQRLVKEEYTSAYAGGSRPRSFLSPSQSMTLEGGVRVTRSDAESVVTPEDLYYVLNKQSIDADTKLFVDKAIGEAANYYKAPMEGMSAGKEIRTRRSAKATPGVRWPKRERPAPEVQMQTPMEQPTPEGLIEPAAQDVSLTIRPGLEQNRMSGYSDLISKYAVENELPPNLVAAVIWQESRGDPKAVGPYLPKYRTNAKGLMQFLPATLKDMGYDDPFDPEQSIAGGAKYLRQLWDRYGSVELALAAYNWGMGNLDEYRAGEKKTIPTQTSNYVKSIMTDFNKRNQQRLPRA